MRFRVGQGRFGFEAKISIRPDLYTFWKYAARTRDNEMHSSLEFQGV